MTDADIPAGQLSLPGSLTAPPHPAGVVAFAHGSGSSRLSPRNLAVAGALNERGLATLLFDLLTPGEARDRGKVFDIGLLADRLEAGARWVASEPVVGGLPLGLFGASTGAAAALVVAARWPDGVAAIVSRGGRPDLAGPDLERAKAPTLLIVGGDDPQVLQLNREAERALRCEKRLVVVPGAGHLFEEPGAIERVAELAGDWFVQHLGGAERSEPVT